MSLPAKDNSGIFVGSSFLVGFLLFVLDLFYLDESGSSDFKVGDDLSV